ncbi:hypothetical protein [Natronococcus sp. A-GB7]|uniref:hypothetical protein n=1 Tax=Natronococcus sp. A-GB7 TaxID=3037649 RepID=UPI00241DCCBE|nr:hypothetical protein [Natronococcus sp. A-GB7]MDG5821004.1 hypothetical protein [Natronococcus sp. A-GB7]
MKNRETGVAAALAATLFVLLSRGTEILGGLVQRGDAPGVLPTLGTHEETVAAYGAAVGILDQLLLAAIALGVGYALGRRIDLVREYRRFAVAVAVGSAAGVILVGTAAQLLWGARSFGDPGVFVRVLEVASLTVRVALPITGYVFAGAALARLGAARGESGPERNGSDRPADA